MRRGISVLVQAASGAMREGMGSATQREAVRAMSSAHPETALSKFMPAVAGAPRLAFDTAVSLTGKLIVGAATSGPIKSLVTSFADKVVIEEALVKIEDLDPSYWAYWLSATGYTSQAGFKKLADAAKAKASAFSPEQVTNLITGLTSVRYYDKDLYEGLASNISANFTKFDTFQLLTILKSYASAGHYSAQLFDDIADSITYCNHYLAPVKASTEDVIAAIAAYAKFSHERADLLVTLARGISEVGLSKLSPEARHDAVVSGVRSLSALDFYPEQIDALLYYATTNPEAYSADELKDVEKVKATVEAQAGGSLQTYVQNDNEDAVHWYGHHQTPPSQYELYVFRESLVPATYSPLEMRKK